MKIAISHWQGRISPVFDVAQQVLLVDINGSQVVRRQNVSLGQGGPFCRAEEIVGLGVEMLVCGAISHSFEKVLVHAGVRVAGFTCGDVDAILTALQAGRLGDACFRMPGFMGPAINDWRRRHRHAPSGERRKRTYRARRGPGRGGRFNTFPRPRGSGQFRNGSDGPENNTRRQ
jgi:predicted Fe-Mo cluster-binding NifX family protein